MIFVKPFANAIGSGIDYIFGDMAYRVYIRLNPLR